MQLSCTAHVTTVSTHNHVCYQLPTFTWLALPPHDAIKSMTHLYAPAHLISSSIAHIMISYIPTLLVITHPHASCSCMCGLPVITSLMPMLPLSSWDHALSPSCLCLDILFLSLMPRLLATIIVLWFLTCVVLMAVCFPSFVLVCTVSPLSSPCYFHLHCCHTLLPQVINTPKSSSVIDSPGQHFLSSPCAFWS